MYHSTAFHQHVFQDGEIRFQQHQLCGLPSSITTLSHCNAAICLFQCQQIVYTVSRHSNGTLLSMKRFHKLFFLHRCDTAEHSILLCCGINFIVLDLTHIHPAIGMLHACLTGSSCCGQRIITGNQLNRNTLFLEIGNGICCMFPNRINDDNCSKQIQFWQRLIFGNRFLCQTNQQHTFAFLQSFLHFLRQGTCTKPFRRTQKEGSNTFKCHGAPFSIRRKWNLMSRRKSI